MSLDFKRIGEAAVMAYEKPCSGGETEHFEAAGQAAVAAMIPIDEKQGLCHGDCPFFYMAYMKAYCKLEMSKPYEDTIQPGPDCPAKRGDSRG